MVSRLELLEKQVALSAVVVESLHRPGKVTLPTLASYTAPTKIAPGEQAGLEMPSRYCALPDATMTFIPALMTRVIGVTPLRHAQRRRFPFDVGRMELDDELDRLTGVRPFRNAGRGRGGCGEHLHGDSDGEKEPIGHGGAERLIALRNLPSRHDRALTVTASVRLGVGRVLQIQPLSGRGPGCSD
jgi:hypothetical protein